MKDYSLNKGGDITVSATDSSNKFTKEQSQQKRFGSKQEEKMINAMSANVPTDKTEGSNGRDGKKKNQSKDGEKHIHLSFEGIVDFLLMTIHSVILVLLFVSTIYFGYQGTKQLQEYQAAISYTLGSQDGQKVTKEDDVVDNVDTASINVRTVNDEETGLAKEIIQTNDTGSGITTFEIEKDSLKITSNNIIFIIVLQYMVAFICLVLLLKYFDVNLGGAKIGEKSK